MVASARSAALREATLRNCLQLPRCRPRDVSRGSSTQRHSEKEKRSENDYRPIRLLQGLRIIPQAAPARQYRPATRVETEKEHGGPLLREGAGHLARHLVPPQAATDAASAGVAKCCGRNTEEHDCRI